MIKQYVVISNGLLSCVTCYKSTALSEALRLSRLNPSALVLVGEHEALLADYTVIQRFLNGEVHNDEA